jgi:predicted nucleic acid-binding protein
LSALLDTDIVIELRDGDRWIKEQIASLSAPLYISAITRVELENGIHREPEWTSLRRERLNEVLSVVPTLDFSTEEIAAYRRIVEANGYSRRKTADRMTAATALAQGLPLVTLNGRDFRDVPGLELVEWKRTGE